MDNTNLYTLLLKIIQEENHTSFSLFFSKLYEKISPGLHKLTKSRAAAKEIFVDVMTKFWVRFIIQKQELPRNITNYIFTMCRHAWIENQKKANRFRNEFELLGNLDNGLQYHVEDNKNLIEKERLDNLKKNAFTKAVDKLTGKCKEIFIQHIENKTKLKDLWKPMGFLNYQGLVQTNYRCNKKLIKMVYQEYEIMTSSKSLKKK